LNIIGSNEANKEKYFGADLFATISNIFFKLSLGNLAKPDFPCIAVELENLYENFSPGPQ
jgi:hypothetical protein